MRRLSYEPSATEKDRQNCVKPNRGPQEVAGQTTRDIEVSKIQRDRPAL